VLDGGQAMAFHLCPVLWDVGEVFGVLVDLLEEAPLFLYFPEVLLGPMLLAALSR